jgi:truncated hemoglobin YjbI
MAVYRTALVVLCLQFAPATLTAQSVDTATIDRHVFEVLKDIHNRGADLHNAGDTNSCYRMYQGGLMAVRPFLAHRQASQKSIDDGLSAAERREPQQRAIALSKVINEVRDQLRPGVKPQLEGPAPKSQTPSSATPPTNPPATMQPPTGGIDPPASFQPVPAPSLPTQTLWQRLGEEAKMAKAVYDWVSATQADAATQLTLDGKPLTPESTASFKRRVVAYVSFVSEGTLPYPGKPSKDSLSGQSIQTGDVSAALAHFKKALEKQNVSANESAELLKKIEETKADLVAVRAPNP